MIYNALVKDQEKSPYRKATEELIVMECVDKKTILTLPMAAIYLSISEGKLRELAQKRELPCAMLGEKYVFSKALLDKWVEKLCLDFVQEDPREQKPE